eukprot:TRINITY_DN53094_c0_g1_i1.p2 TRINITY_DN53094_c0_g1~~TRINITY_DN53094_c0_g1_i1.p2  ORF type:complete len:406 (-),score=178.96 TRINITY_DN53094_c0_g1_i1:29-1246(-)
MMTTKTDDVAESLRAFAGHVTKLEREWDERKAAENDYDADQPMRELYSTIRLSMMDYEEREDVAAELRCVQLLKRGEEPSEGLRKARVSEDGGSAVVHESVQAVLDEYNALLARLAVRHTRPTTKWWLLLRLVLFIVHLLVWFLPILVFAVLRPTHIWLRRLGLHNNHLPLDVVSMWYNRSLCQLLRITVRVEGQQHIELERSVVLMFTHASNLDPFLTGCGPIAPKWVAKQVLFFVPIFGWLMWLVGNIGINRAKKAQAIKSIEKAAGKVNRWGRSIALSPEGTRSKTGRLLPFKNGPFHLTVATKLPVQPVLIIGAHELWPPGQSFASSGEVTIRYLPCVHAEKDESYDALRQRVQRVILRGLCARRDPKATQYFALWERAMPTAFICAFYSVVWKLVLTYCY